MKFPAISRPAFASLRLSPLLTGAIAALLLATTLSAGFAIYALIGPQSQTAQSAAPDWKPPTLAIVELPPPKPSSADVQTLSRPIFTKNRKPAVKPSGAAPAAAPAPEATDEAPAGLTLSAIVKHGGVASAFVISPTAPEGEWKKIGERVDTWTIAAIADVDLTLTNGDQAVKLRLFDEKADASADKPEAFTGKPDAPAGKPEEFVAKPKELPE